MNVGGASIVPLRIAFGAAPGHNPTQWVHSCGQQPTDRPDRRVLMRMTGLTDGLLCGLLITSPDSSSSRSSDRSCDQGALLEAGTGCLLKVAAISGMQRRGEHLRARSHQAATR
jgi:hypothetical protein